jgi:hypothetical protein
VSRPPSRPAVLPNRETKEQRHHRDSTRARGHPWGDAHADSSTELRTERRLSLDKGRAISARMVPQAVRAPTPSEHHSYRRLCSGRAYRMDRGYVHFWVRISGLTRAAPWTQLLAAR